MKNSIIVLALIIIIILISISFYYIRFEHGEIKNKVTIEMIAKQWRFEVVSIDNPKLASFNFTPISNTLGNLTITIKLNTLVKLNIKSVDITHGFAIDEYRINEVIPSNQIVEIEFIANKQGIFVFYCSVFCGTGHPYHKGYLIVIP